MKFEVIVYCIILVFFGSIGEIVGLLVYGNMGNLIDNIYGFIGYNVDLFDMM